MISDYIDKVEDVRRRLSNIQSATTALSEALAFSGYDAEEFTGTANLISDNIEVAVNDLCELVNEMTHA